MDPVEVISSMFYAISSDFKVSNLKEIDWNIGHLKDHRIVKSYKGINIEIERFNNRHDSEGLVKFNLKNKLKRRKGGRGF